MQARACPANEKGASPHSFLRIENVKRRNVQSSGERSWFMLFCKRLPVMPQILIAVLSSLVFAGNLPRRPPSQVAASTADAGALRALIDQYFAAYAQKDLAGFMR